MCHRYRCTQQRLGQIFGVVAVTLDLKYVGQYVAVGQKIGTGTVDALDEREFAHVALDIVHDPRPQDWGIGQGGHRAGQQLLHLFVGRRFQFKAVTYLHEFFDFLVDVVVSNTNDGVERLVFHPLLLRFFLANEFHQGGDADLVAVVHAVDFVHDDGDWFVALVHHVQDIAVGDVVRGDVVDDLFVAHIGRIVDDGVVSVGGQQIRHELGFAAPR